MTGQGRQRLAPPMTGRMLIAGVGNIFLGDDGFGPEVAKRLAAVSLPGWVRVADYGISGMHLAYDLADGYDTAILIDAAPHGEKPGTVTLLAPTPPPRAALAPAPPPRAALAPAPPPRAALAPAPPPRPRPDVAAECGPEAGPDAETLGASRLFDAHGMQPDVVLGVLDMLGAARPARILVVGCEPASVDYGMELSEPVAKAVDEAVQVVLDLVAEAGRGHETPGAAGTPAAPPQTPQTIDKGVSHVPWHSR
jgi:hydrogenase maturation protease